MNNFTPDRRSLLKAGGGLLAVAATMSAEQLLGYAKAWAQASQWKPEAGAKINLLSEYHQKPVAFEFAGKFGASATTFFHRRARSSAPTVSARAR